MRILKQVSLFENCVQLAHSSRGEDKMNINQETIRKKRIIGFFIGAFIFFSIEMFLLYNYECYRALTGTGEQGLSSFLASLSALLTGQWKLEFSSYLIFNTLLAWVNIWYINIVCVLIILLSASKMGSFKGIEHGSARWASKDEKKMFMDSTNAIPVADQMYVPIKNSRLKNLNQIIVGDTGAAKTYRQLIPELLALNGSYLITDTKGALYRQTVNIFRKRKYKIKVLNLLNLNYSNTFNPLKYIESDGDIDRLVNTFVMNSRREGSSSGEQFWEDTMTMLMTSIIKYLKDTENEEHNFSRILDLVRSLKTTQNGISPDSEYEKIMQNKRASEPMNSSVINYDLFKQAPPETLQSCLISLTSRLRLWATKEVRILTNSDEMDLDTVGLENTVIYLIIPDSDNTYKTISSMFLSTIITKLYWAADIKCSGKLPILFNLELDEIANIGKIPNFDNYISTMRSRNIRASIVIQNEQQLEKLYEKADKTIISNCLIYNYLGVNDTDTRERLIKKLGKITIEESNRSRNVGGKQGGGSESDRGLGRELLTIDELNRMPNEDSIVVISGFAPFYCTKTKTEQHPLSNELGIDDPKSSNYSNNAYIEQDFESLYIRHQDDYRRYESAKAQDFLSNDSIDESLDIDIRTGTPSAYEISEEDFENGLSGSSTRNFIDALKSKNQ